MGSSRKQTVRASSVNLRTSARDIARMRNGAALGAGNIGATSAAGRHVPLVASALAQRRRQDALLKKVCIFVVALIVLFYLSLGIMGAQGDTYPYAGRYVVYNPAQVTAALLEHAYNAIATATHLYSAHSNEYILENVPGYWGVTARAKVVGITLICAVLLSISGMLYQNAFKNPIAGPGMLGVSSGVSLGVMVLVWLFGSEATAMVAERYEFCYLFGFLILVFVMAAGKKLSGKNKPFDIVTMLLVGSVLSQLLGFVVSYFTLYLMDESDYLVFYTISQMLTVDTSLVSWVVLAVVCVLSITPIVVLRYKFNLMGLDDQDARLLGANPGRLRMVALVCGALMILAAQIHVGAVSLISLIVPFAARSIFGCEFRAQLIGNFVIGMPLLLACRDLCDLIPFIGDGLAIGSVVSVAAMPLFVVMMARQMRGWE